MNVANTQVPVKKAESKPKVTVFEDINKDFEKDAEIANSSDEREMSVKDGFSTGIPLRKDENEIRNASDVEKGQTPVADDIFDVFKSDDELDYDLDDEKEENWKRKSVKDEDQASSKKSRTETSKKDKERERKHPNSKSSSREHRNRQTSSRRHDHHKECSRSEKKNERKDSNHDIKDSKMAESKLPERSGHKRNSLTSKAEIKNKRSKTDDAMRHAAPKDTPKEFAYRHESQSSGDRENNNNQELPDSSGLYSPLSVYSQEEKSPIAVSATTTVVDGIAIANKVRNDVMKLNDFWKGDTSSKKRPVSGNSNILKEDTSPIREANKSETISKFTETKSGSGGRWEAPFITPTSEIQAKLKQIASDTKKLGKLKELSEKQQFHSRAKDVESKDENGRMHGDRSKPSSSSFGEENISMKDSVLKERGKDHDVKRFAEDDKK